VLHIFVQVKELVSSNLNSMVTAAGNPVTMLSHFQRQLQEYIVTLQGDLTRAQRQQERLASQALELDLKAADWTDKARIAMDHKREDLARSALLTREQTEADARAARAAAEAAGAEAGQIAEAIRELEAKLAETDAQLAEERQRKLTASSAAAGASTTRSERVLDRVATLEKRVDFATEQKPAPASVDAEIEQLRREAKVSAELAAMKAAAKGTPASKASQKARPRKPAR
jgi:phage shock protein A